MRREMGEAKAGRSRSTAASPSPLVRNGESSPDRWHWLKAMEVNFFGERLTVGRTTFHGLLSGVVESELEYIVLARSAAPRRSRPHRRDGWPFLRPHHSHCR